MRVKTENLQATMPPGNYVSFTRKHFTIKLVKSPLKKKEESKLFLKKSTRHEEKKTEILLTLSLRILLLFKNFFIPLFSASYDLLKARVFRNNTISLKIYLA